MAKKTFSKQLLLKDAFGSVFLETTFRFSEKQSLVSRRKYKKKKISHLSVLQRRKRFLIYTLENKDISAHCHKWNTNVKAHKLYMQTHTHADVEISTRNFTTIPFIHRRCWHYKFFVPSSTRIANFKKCNCGCDQQNNTIENT